MVCCHMGEPLRSLVDFQHTCACAKSSCLGRRSSVICKGVGLLTDCGWLGLPMVDPPPRVWHVFSYSCRNEIFAAGRKENGLAAASYNLPRARRLVKCSLLPGINFNSVRVDFHI
jgi:hypothetical protein